MGKWYRGKECIVTLARLVVPVLVVNPAKNVRPAQSVSLQLIALCVASLAWSQTCRTEPQAVSLVRGGSIPAVLEHFAPSVGLTA